MTTQDLAAYSRSPGAFLNTPRAVQDAAAAKRLLDQRDIDHLASYGHKPGRSPVCTLPGRESYEGVGVPDTAPDQRCVIPWGARTSTAQEMIGQLAPWAYIPAAGGDPAVEQARRELAAKIAAQQVTG
jgi:hypothetical protein